MIEQWHRAAAALFGAGSGLRQLDGEYDLNFRATGADGGAFILKIMREDCATAFIEMQIGAISQLRADTPDLPIPALRPALSGAAIVPVRDADGQQRLAWAQEARPGRPLALFRDRPLDLMGELGGHIGRVSAGLQGYDHPLLDRADKWNLLSALWIRDHLSCIDDPARRALIADICKDFEAALPDLNTLPVQSLHNDFNDYNILVAPKDEAGLCISGMFDFGDMLRAPAMIDPAIAGAYAVLGSARPEAELSALVAGFHRARPLAPREVALIWPVLRMRLAVSVVNSTLEAAARPDDPYVTISQAPAWAFLERPGIDAGLGEARLRAACGFPVTAGAARVARFLGQTRGRFAPVMQGDLAAAASADVSVAHALIPENPLEMTAAEAARVGLSHDPLETTIGGYGEPRLIYTAPAFRRGLVPAEGRRTVHVGVDVFQPAGAPVAAPLSATVAVAENRTGHLDYGGMVILAHETPEGDRFYTLYGHLDPASIAHLAPATPVAAGAVFARLGDQDVNGGWSPHLHFQLAMLTNGLSDDWPGVVFPEELDFWRLVFPNPAALLNLSDDKIAHRPIDEAALRAERAGMFAANLKLSYRRPLMLLRGWKHHLFDQTGQPYLDAYNNVPHVGHAHPRIRRLAAEQLARMNSNTRYLHPAQTALARALCAKLPAELSVCFLVNSGSEANELALRLARAHTGGKDMVVPDHGYHGNTTGAIDLSAYKFDRPGGGGRPDWVQLVEVADDYRGRFRRDVPDRGARFAALVDPALAAIRARGGALAGFIAETYPSVGGQIIPPPGYLRAVHDRIRAAGGVCIADEVQTGLGRLGTHYFAFEEQGAVPDIVVLGKPLGNGHPVGAVITTQAIADSFANGIEFFSTFGGSTLSCLIAREVLEIVEDEGLQANAAAMGARLLDGLRGLQDRHRCIGDVRGRGLFAGVDLVTDRDSRAPATELAGQVLNRMRARHVLIGTEGPDDNILKIRPPLTIDAANVDFLIGALDRSLAELAPAGG